MSLRGRMNKGSLVQTETPTADAKGSLRRASSGGVAKPTGRGLAAVEKVSKRANVSGRGNIGFLIDATASRSSTWEEAQSIQSKMFESVTGMGSMGMRLVHFGGNQLSANDWTKDTKEMASKMADVSCRGGQTQIIDGFNAFLSDADSEKANSIILIGDSYEESEYDIEETANRLKDKGIKVFAFHEGDDHWGEAENAFKKFAEITGGTFAKFGADMPLQDLCEGVALLTVGGQSALNRLKNAGARQLLLSGPK
jgi:hypothetical protein